MLKTAEAGHQLIQCLLSAVAERAVTKVMAQADRFGKAFIEIQSFGDSPADLRHLDTVGQPRAVIVVDTGGKHLRLAFEPSKGRTMYYPVTVSLERGSVRMPLFGKQPTAAGCFADSITGDFLRHFQTPGADGYPR